MDAISFVVGLQSKDLRGKQLKDLVFKASADEDICALPPLRIRGAASDGSALFARSDVAPTGGCQLESAAPWPQRACT